MKNFITRAITAIVYVIALVGCVYWSPLTSYLFFALIAAATVYEFGTIANRHYGANVNRPMSAMTAVLLCSIVWEWQCGIGDYSKMAALYGMTLLYIIIIELYRGEDDALKNWTITFAAQLYISLPFAIIPLLSIHYDAAIGGMSYDWIYTLSIFIFLWMNDTGAYIVGSILGRYVPYKLFPRISPKKSWIGSIGGAILTLIAATIIWYALGNGQIATTSGTLSLSEWLGLGLIVVVFGTWGDLVESLIKRQMNIKDSGKILPGHGGLLDRFDSALLAIPAAVIYLALI